MGGFLVRWGRSMVNKKGVDETLKVLVPYRSNCEMTDEETDEVRDGAFLLYL